jgi:folate-binding protein YgfZ
MGTVFYTQLSNRGLICISGPDRRGFLQGLISNDITLLDSQPCVYACLLNAQGKFLHDFLITEENDTLFLDCEGGARTHDLFKRLNMYKLRANIQISCLDTHSVYAVMGINIGHPDPRHPMMGYRTFTKPMLPEQPFAAWDSLRISLTIPDGSRDMIPEKSTLLESGIDKLNGVSFEKGCYTGQELTARMHYRGLAKKHLYTVHVGNHPLPDATHLSLSLQGEGLRERALPALGEDIHLNGQLIGEMRSSCGNSGLALIKDEFSHFLA